MVAEYVRNLMERVTAKNGDVTEEGLEHRMSTDSNTSASEGFEMGGVS
jgi:hypothetical protein